ncbi:excalibur calcium-binding domain-containing protein [Mycobacterium barrassiae]|uniref:excalibur calcium-binding domain-containing protein n=1 Tax=Mycobacterium barrassiae TaxID=319709 RepID=UPI002265C124|nr:excalibur calcium-binding domain-containing protein [Mycobacterium barrassiae]MCV7300652.1 excalibur calcium-binding domain-containing protein [Mycobacterium barrassiae]
MTRTIGAGLLLASIVAVGPAPLAEAQQPYRNCSEARANGDTNIPSTSPYYGPHLDRDNDGIGCES